jgi:hypothetical protein
MYEQNYMMIWDGGETPTTALAAELAQSADHRVCAIVYPGFAVGQESNDSYEIDLDHLKEANRYLMRANKNMHRSWPRRQIAADNALRRDMWISRWVHRIYIIGLFTQDASLLKINTDTAWLAQMYLDRFLYDQEPIELCEIFLFDMKSESWWSWNQQWQRVDSAPQPDGVYAIIGQDKLTNAGKSALKGLFINQ